MHILFGSSGGDNPGSDTDEKQHVHRNSFQVLQAT